MENYFENDAARVYGTGEIKNTLSDKKCARFMYTYNGNLLSSTRKPFQIYIKKCIRGIERLIRALKP